MHSPQTKMKEIIAMARSCTACFPNTGFRYLTVMVSLFFPARTTARNGMVIHPDGCRTSVPMCISVLTRLEPCQKRQVERCCCSDNTVCDWCSFIPGVNLAVEPNASSLEV